jgi:hypothetical protein
MNIQRKERQLRSNLRFDLLMVSPHIFIYSSCFSNQHKCQKLPITAYNILHVQVFWSLQYYRSAYSLTSGESHRKENYCFLKGL